MASSRSTIDIIISTVLKRSGIDAARKAMASFASKVGSNLMNIKAGFEMVAGVAKSFVSAISSGMKFETMTVQFKNFITTMDAAREHMRDLKELGDTPPFSLEQFAAASRQLMVMSDGVLGYKQSLVMIGDAAAATGVPIETLGHSVGRMYSLIRDGQPISRAAMELRNLGIITPEIVQKMQDMQNAGKSAAEIWQLVTESLARYKGAMTATEQTGEGLVAAIQTRWDNAVRAFSTRLNDASKEGLGGLLDAAKELEEDGSIEVWADRTGRAIGRVVNACRSAFGWIGKTASWIGDKWAKVTREVNAAAAFWGAKFAGGSTDDALKAWRDSKEADDGARAGAAERETNIREAAKERARKRAADNEKREKTRAAEEESKLAEAFAQADEKREIERLDKLSKDESERAEKAQADSFKDEMQLRRKEMERLHAERMKQLDAEKAKVEKDIADLERRGAATPVEMARTLDQAGELREERQNEMNESRYAKAKAALEKRMAKTGATLDDPSKLGRLSNFERATLERMRLDKDRRKAADLEKEREEREKKQAKSIAEIEKIIKAGVSI